VTTGERERALSDVDRDERMVANAAGALDVVRASSATVDDQLAAISARTTEQADETAAVVDDVSGLSATIEEIAARTAEVNDQSERAAAEAADGRAAAAETRDVLRDVQDASEAAVEEMATLQSLIDDIATALAGIDEIADQTNMLALNASIQAAHADESAGFAVVADEIEALATDSQAQAESIDELLEEVRDATERTVDQLERATDEIDRGLAHADTTIGALEDVSDAVERTAAGVGSVDAAVDEQAETSERVTQRVERVAAGVREIDADVETIRQARSEQTAMLTEIDEVLASVDAARLDRIAGAPRLSTGLPALDRLCDGGLIEGGRAVVRHDAEAVGDVVARVCASALGTDWAVSLTPPPTLDRASLEATLSSVDTDFDTPEAERAGESALDAALRSDRLFVLDAFDSWEIEENVFDLRSQSLRPVNRTVDERRDRPLLVVGNIAGEIEVLGEEGARNALYENDDGVLDPRDTVLNVVDDDAVPESFAAFYAGSADQVVRAQRKEGDWQVELASSPSGSTGVERTTVAPTAPVRHRETD
jgi:archaellum component FlaC